ncbi:gamma-glutamyltransferase [Rhodopseudomonas pseudopalustris]|uniref:gamma-glutamyltransferase n=1 Tax=Rhodopseudomonas pseudopalustris TaxID=1513892 RepID=UPI003F98E21B
MVQTTFFLIRRGPHRLASLLLHCGIITALLLGIASAQDRRGASAPLGAPMAVVGTRGMVVAQERLAAEVGRDVLSKGGNAVDAAVATGFAMAVTYPRAGNIGGGGFMLIHRAGGDDVAIDYRETAPDAASRDMFLGADGKPDNAKSRDSALGIGVPGTVAGLTLALEKYGSGKFSLAELLQPAIALARDGFVVSDDLADTLPDWHRRLTRWPSTARVLARPDGGPYREGDWLVQSDLAATLQAIAAQGARGFYDGPVADRLARAVQDAGGLITTEDLRSYQALIRMPLRGSYRGYDIVAMPLPSSAGPVLIESLNILEGLPLRDAPQGSAQSLHWLIEAMKRGYADRARYLGDPAFVDAPLSRLLDKDFAAKQRASIHADRATPATEMLPPPREGDNTTHFSVVDAQGNAVSNTTTLNFSYGVGLIAEGTGVLLNNELDDFTAAPGAANAFGLVGFEANLPGPGKRPLSSMAPTIVLKDGKVLLVTGSPGGSRIISAVLQVMVNVLDYQMDVAAAVAAPRVHHQWQPDEVRVERGFDPAVVGALQSRGHRIVTPLGQTSANSILITAQGPRGAPDPRTRGAAAAAE